jgi:hypothetical protein
VSNEEEVPVLHFNGWQRLWLLASIVWAVAILALAGVFQSNGDQVVPSANTVLLVVRLWIVPVAAIYAFGLGLAWVRRGFQVESK